MVAPTIIMREEARQAGLKRYFVGEPCKHGHVAPRLVRDNACLECRRIGTNKWRLNNRTHIYAENREWRAEHPELVAAQQRRWYLANAERLRAKAKINSVAWRADNPDKHAAKERTRRARKRACGGSHDADDIAEIRKAQKDRCAACGVKLNGGGEVDHIEPLLSGGSNSRSNLQILCEFHNRSKGAKDPVEFMQSLGKLL
jgi:HNH endonuclease